MAYQDAASIGDGFAVPNSLKKNPLDPNYRDPKTAPLFDTPPPPPAQPSNSAPGFETAPTAGRAPAPAPTPPPPKQNLPYYAPPNPPAGIGPGWDVSRPGAVIGPGIPQPPKAPTAPTPPSGGFNWDSYPDPKSGFLAALNAGQSGEGLVSSANSRYNLGYGGGFAYYPNKDVYASPGGGYYAKGPDGKWGWNVGDSGGPSPAPTQIGPQIPSFSAPPAYNADFRNPSVFEGPTQPVGTDPLSQATDATLMKLMANRGRDTSPTGQAGLDALQTYLKNGGDATARLGALRDQMAILERGQLADTRSELANRGTLGEGAASGPEIDAMNRLQQNLGERYSAAAAATLNQNDANLLSAIQTATGLDDKAVQAMLSTAQTADQRQQMLSTLALQSLSQNISFQEFMANNKLSYAQLKFQIENGNAANIIALYNAQIYNQAVRNAGAV